MHAGVKLPTAPSSKFGIFAQSSLLSIDHVLVGKWQGGSKPLRLYQPSRWAELAKTREGSVEEREKVFGYQRRLFAKHRKKGSCMLGWQAVGWLIQDNDARRCCPARRDGCQGAERACSSVLGIIRGGN